MRLKRYESKSDYYANDKSYSTLELNEEGAEFIRCHFSLNEIMKFYNNDDVFSKKHEMNQNVVKLLDTICLSINFDKYKLE